MSYVGSSKKIEADLGAKEHHFVELDTEVSSQGTREWAAS